MVFSWYLYATRRRTRLLHIAATVVCLLGVYFTLQNSWWLEAGVALIIMTIIYSRRLLIFYMMLLLPLLPVLKAEYAKLQ